MDEGQYLSFLQVASFAFLFRLLNGELGFLFSMAKIIQKHKWVETSWSDFRTNPNKDSSIFMQGDKQ